MHLMNSTDMNITYYGFVIETIPNKNIATKANVNNIRINDALT